MRKESEFIDNGVVYPMGPTAVKSAADCYKQWIHARLLSCSKRKKKKSPKIVRKEKVQKISTQKLGNSSAETKPSEYPLSYYLLGYDL